MKLDLLIISLAPIIACILWIYLKDKYEKEPIKLLGKFFILGSFISVPGIVIEQWLVESVSFEGYTNLLYIAFIVAALTEESLKWIVLFPNIIKDRNFNERLDGIIYSIFTSLGFATVENIIYVFSQSSEMAIEVGLMRSVVSIPAHVMFAISMGSYLSKYKFSSGKVNKRQNLILSILVPIILHGVFDFILMIKFKWSIILFIVYTIFLWKINLDILDEYANKSKNNFFRKRKYIKK